MRPDVHLPMKGGPKDSKATSMGPNMEKKEGQGPTTPNEKKKKRKREIKKDDSQAQKKLKEIK